MKNKIDQIRNSMEELTSNWSAEEKTGELEDTSEKSIS